MAAVAAPSDAAVRDKKAREVVIPSERARTGYADIDDQDPEVLLAIQQEAWKPQYDSASGLTAHSGDSKSQTGLEVSAKTHEQIIIRKRAATVAQTAAQTAAATAAVAENVSWASESYATQLWKALAELGIADASALARYRIHIVVEPAEMSGGTLSVSASTASQLLAEPRGDDVVLVYGWGKQRGILQPWAAHTLRRLKRMCVLKDCDAKTTDDLKTLLPRTAFDMPLDRLLELRKTLHRHSLPAVHVSYWPLSFRDIALAS